MKAGFVDLNKVQVVGNVAALGGRLTVKPRYNLESNAADLEVGYLKDGNEIIIDPRSKKVTFSKSFENGKIITPTVDANGDFSLEYSFGLESGGRMTTTWTPDDSVSMIWHEGEWQTTVRAPIQGYFRPTSGVKVMMKRKLDMEYFK